MKLLGLIGGMNWENTIEYYKIINQLVQNRKGSWNSAKLLLFSVNFEQILKLQNENKWEKIAKIMIDISKKLENFGCNALILCSNTIHKVASDIESEISIPLINVIDKTAEDIKRNKIRSIGLLGTRFTMEGDFYVDRLKQNHNLNVFLPTKVEIEYIHSTIYNEFAKGEFLKRTKRKYLEIIKKLKENGAEGIILGCTEIPMLIKPKDVNIPLFDTLKIHLNAAVDFILN